MAWEAATQAQLIVLRPADRPRAQRKMQQGMVDLDGKTLWFQIETTHPPFFVVNSFFRSKCADSK